MLGQIIWGTGRMKLQVVEIEGLHLLRGEISREGGFWRVRLRRLLRKMQGQGVGRILVPADFNDWDLAQKCGMKPVDALPFLRRFSGEIMVLALKKGGYPPDKCTVALRGTRVSRAMIEAADTLVSQVRDIAVSAQHGGEGLQRMLRQEWGLAVRPDGEQVEGAIRFDSGGSQEGAVILSIFGAQPELGGLEENRENLPLFSQTEWLPLLAALWESGKIGRDSLEFYLT